MRVEIDGPKVSILGARRDVIRELDKVLSYPVEGAWFAPSFRRGRWDGKVHFIHIKRGGGYIFPIGLLPDALLTLRNLGVEPEVTDNRQPGRELTKHGFASGVQIRPYQDQAVGALIEGKGGVGSLGILKMPIRSGKTLTASLLIERIGLKTLFVVPSLLLADQSASVFRRVFDGLEVTTLCEGRIASTKAEIVVATFQSLMAGYKRRDMFVGWTLDTTGLLIVDECHHLEAEEWRKPLLECPAPARVGLSATAYISRRKPNERSALWLKALCGPIVYEVSMDYLVKKGWLVQTEVRLFTVESPATEGKWDSRLYDRLITNNHLRNSLIVGSAVEARDGGRRVLVDIGRVEHGKVLLSMLRAAGLRVALLIGSSQSDDRAEVIGRLKAGTLDVVVSTLLGEGVDIPELEVVINAEGGASKKTTIQRLRNMTPAEGKDAATIVDFIDLTNPYLARHSLERLRTYRGEGCFTIRTVQA